VRSLTRRAFVGVLAAVAVSLPHRFGRTTVSQDDDELVIVNGWVLRKSDLGIANDDR
jgi:hypothetical protein